MSKAVSLISKNYYFQHYIIYTHRHRSTMGVLDEFATPSVAITRLVQLASWEPEGLLGFPSLPLVVELGTAYRNLCLQVNTLTFSQISILGVRIHLI